MLSLIQHKPLLNLIRFFKFTTQWDVFVSKFQTEKKSKGRENSAIF